MATTDLQQPSKVTVKSGDQETVEGSKDIGEVSKSTKVSWPGGDHTGKVGAVNHAVSFQNRKKCVMLENLAPMYI